MIITAGPTFEKIDPVRFIGNYSSGKMGFALAEVCAQRGAHVLLITGPVALKTNHPDIRRIDVESAEQMYNAVTNAFPQTDIAILCAAVADYRPEVAKKTKIKRDQDEIRSLALIRNKDIAATLGKEKRNDQIVVGFALETNNGIMYAKDKLIRKNMDLIVLNSLEDKGAGFQQDTNKVTIIDKQGNTQALPLQSKLKIAGKIIDRLVMELKND